MSSDEIDDLIQSAAVLSDLRESLPDVNSQLSNALSMAHELAEVLPVLVRQLIDVLDYANLVGQRLKSE